jgi:hypothetical protein
VGWGPALQSCNNPLWTSRDAVVVDGELLVKGRVLATIDEEESNSKAKKTTAILVAGFLDKARA